MPNKKYRPVTLEHFIQLVTEEKLNKDWIKKWYQTVKNNAPSGVISGIEQSDDQGEPRVTKLIRRENKNGENKYIIPLTRDLTNEETERIIEKWSKIFGSEWDVDISASPQEFQQDTGDIAYIDEETYSELCHQITKQQHNKWCRQKVEDGWEYGPKYSLKNKTHPMLLSWDQLPEKWKEIDYELPEIIIDTLNRQGYKIVQKE